MSILDPEQRLQRVEQIISELLSNESIDNARRGPLRVPDADIMPRFLQGGRRVQWVELSFTGGGVYLAASGGTPGAMVVQMLTTADASDTNLMDARTVLNLLPDFRCAFTHGGAPVQNIVRIGLVDQPLANLTEPNGAFFRSSDAGNWFAVVRDSGSETAFDTGVTAGSVPIREFQIVVPQPTRVEFYIDGNLEYADSGANLPPGDMLLRANVELYARAGATGASLTAFVSDYMAMSRQTRG